NQLTLDHIKSVYKDGSELADWNSKLKSFTQIFGTNNPLFQTGYGFKKGKGPSETNIAIYKSTLKGFLSEISKTKDGPRCWACGTPSDFDFAQICRRAIEENGRKAPEDKWMGRDWFPLAGSLGSDAQALPAASKPPHICPKCLFAIHYLPMGVMSLDRRLAVFQSTSTEFWYDIIRDIVGEVKGRIQAGNYETLGKKEGNKALLIRLLGVFERLQGKKYLGYVPEGTTLYIWCFSNSGQEPKDHIRCKIKEIPNPALVFLWNAVENGLRREIEFLIESEGKNPRFTMLRCILEGRDYHNLYPEGRRKGASPRLFALYQIHICNHSIKSLQIAHKLAKEVSIKLGEKELKRLQRSEAFREEKNRNMFKSLMAQMAERGDLTLEEYLDLFPLKDGQGIAVEWGGWNLIRFYLHHTDEDLPEIDDLYQKKDRIPQEVLFYAGKIYTSYLKEKGKDRFKKEVLKEMGRKIDMSWLRSQFLKLAELEEGFTYGHWLKLCTLDDGKTFVQELLFQMRLLWSQWMYEDRTTSPEVQLPVEEISADGLPQRIRELLDLLFIDYVERRGIDRFNRDILARLRRKELGLFWFKEKLTKEICEDVQPLSEGEWEEFLLDEEGRDMRWERLFQLHLALANLYRMKISVEREVIA
ncbi:MAG: hypothetical protein ACXQT5_00280, partial [Candidatus Syntropharchaeia archaeon]